MTETEKRKEPMNPKIIVHSLKDRAVRSSDPSAVQNDRGWLSTYADRLEGLGLKCRYTGVR